MNEKELIVELEKLSELLEELENESMKEDIDYIEAMELDIEIGMTIDAIESYGNDLYKIMY
ncbi:MAG TPA: hypothetical protein IAC02_02730 [Candidatus Coprovivens excrementavium]|nr:hypothetical protein [Candidatus Coprovivens excrementavium]